MRVGLGYDIHQLVEGRKLILGGIIFENSTPLSGNSDADVVLHSITNAVSGITCKNILGKVADDMCKSGITDSEEYLKEALKYLGEKVDSSNDKIYGKINLEVIQCFSILIGCMWFWFCRRLFPV